LIWWRRLSASSH
jgi:hypothetical protein